MQKLLIILLVFGATLTTTGCGSLQFPGVFRIDVGQGNLITKDMVDKLRVGMTPRQVRYVMGSPMIADTYNPNRWDYLYNLETGKGLLVENHLVLHFEGERLARIDTTEYKDPEQLRKQLLEQMGIKVEPATADEADSSDSPEELVEPEGSVHSI